MSDAPGDPVVSAARFPGLQPSRAHYESFFLKACHPAGGLGVWIRYTVHKRGGVAPKGFVWFTLFDSATGVVASKVEAAEPAAPPGTYIRLGDSVFAPGLVTGAARSSQLEASWELEFHGDAPPVWHLPRWAYAAPLPRTKLLSPHPAVSFSGLVRAGARTIELDNWPGTIGHNWGSEHARRSIWIHGANLRPDGEAWLDLALAQVGIGPFTTPWVGNGELSLDGRRHRLGGIERIRSTHVEEAIERCRFSLNGEDVRLVGEVGARREDFVGWIYSQPKGGERQTINCSIADIHVEVLRPGREALMLELRGGAAYELQMQERYAAIPVQPFPDG